MPRRKADPCIGKRAYEEAYTLADTAPAVSTLLGADRKLLYSWLHGATPEVFYLVKLHELGGRYPIHPYRTEVSGSNTNVR